MSKLKKSCPYLICILSILFANGRAVAQPRDDEAKRIFDRAVQSHQSGDTQSAIREYQSFLTLHPGNVEARSNLGAVYARLGRYREAIEQYQEALSVDGGNTAVRFNLAVALYKAARIGQAAEELSKVTAAQPENLNAMLLLADCYLRLGEHRRVIELLTPLEAKRPDDKAVAYLLGTALIRDRQFESGQLVIDRVLRDGESAEARLLLGTAQLMAMESAGALRDLARAIELNPKLPSAHAYYGRALLESGDAPRAMEAFRRELELNPNDFESNLYMGVLLKQEKRNDEALNYFERALSVRPGAVEVRHQIGTLLYSDGKLVEAQRVLEGVVKEAPDFVEAHVALATIYYRLKRKEDGDRHRAIVLKLNEEAQARQTGAKEEGSPARRNEGPPRAPGDTRTEPSRLMAASTPPSDGGVNVAPHSSAASDEVGRRAGAAREAGQLAEAVALYQQAVRVEPSWKEGLWYLGTLSYELDRYAEAREAFRRLVELEPKAGAAWALMGLCEFRLREYDRALEHIQRGRALGLGDNDHLVFVTRYHAALLLTRFEQYEQALEILSYYARTLPNENPSITEALGLSSLRMPFLPSELPAGKRELVLKAGKAAFHQYALHWDEGRREFAQLLALYPDAPNVHYAYGLFLSQEGADPEAALKEFVREIEISPSHVPARLQLAYIYINRREYAAGLPFAEKAAALAPGSFVARNALGRILTETGQVARAIKELETGVRLAPDSPEMYYALARAYARAGRKEDAERARADFARLDKLRRAQREGPEASGLSERPTGSVPPR